MTMAWLHPILQCTTSGVALLKKGEATGSVRHELYLLDMDNILANGNKPQDRGVRPM
jgi:hypothetical protein